MLTIRSIHFGAAVTAIVSVAAAHAAECRAWRSSDQLEWKAVEGSLPPGLASPELVHLSRPTPSRTGPDAGAILLYGRRGNDWSLWRSLDQGRTWGSGEAVVLNGWPKDQQIRQATSVSAVQLDDGRIRIYMGLGKLDDAPPTMPRWPRPESPPDVPDRTWPPPADRPNDPKPVIPPRPTFPIPDSRDRSSSSQPGEDRQSVILSAISNDGVNFAVEDGVRFELAGIDEPEVIRLADRASGSDDARRIGPWLMFLERGGDVLLATSPDGLTWKRDETFVWAGRKAPAAIVAVGDAVPPRSVRLFAETGDGLRSAVFDPATGKITDDEGTRRDAGGESPAVCAAGDGTYLLMRVDEAADKTRWPGIPGDPGRVPNQPKPPIPPPSPRPGR